MTRRVEAPLLWALAASLSVVACRADSDELEPADAGAPPPADASAPPPADTGVPSPADAGPEVRDAGLPPPARTLTQRGLLGDTPVENRFFNPVFDLSAQGWLAFAPNSGRRATVRRLRFDESPRGAPVLMLPKAPENPGGVAVLGTARGGAGTLRASLWVGRRVGDEDPVPSISMVGLVEGQGTLSYDFEPTAESRIQMSGISWQEWTLVVRDGPLAFVQIFIEDDAAAPLYLTAPVMTRTQLSARGGAHVDLRPASPRALRTVERRGLEVLTRSMWDQLGSGREHHQPVPGEVDGKGARNDPGPAPGR